MIDIVLIRPRYSLASSLYQKPGRGGVKESYPPLGLYYLEATLKKYDYSVEIIDGLFLDNEAIFNRLREISPTIIGIYVISSNMPEVLSLIKGIHLITNSPIILGGPHITHCPESVSFFTATYGIRGDSEESFLKFADFSIRGKGNIENIPGIIFKSNGSWRISDKADIQDLDKLPFPNFKLAADIPYFFPLSSEKMTTMIASRGCPFDCVYCGLPNKRCFKTRSIGNIIDEIKINISKGYHYIDFKDDIFTYYMRRIGEFCAVIIKEDIKFKWGCETRVDFLSEELIRKMNDAGCCNIKFGIESVVSRVQKTINKVIPIEKIKNIFNLVKLNGIEVIAYFSLGHPGESLSEMKETVDAIGGLRPDYMDVTLCSPIPGSRLFDIAVREGKIKKNFWEEVEEIKMMPIYAPGIVKLDQMRQLQRRAYRKFYFNCRYIFQEVRKIKTSSEFWDKARIAMLLWKEACR